MPARRPIPGLWPAPKETHEQQTARLLAETNESLRAALADRDREIAQLRAKLDVIYRFQQEETK